MMSSEAHRPFAFAQVLHLPSLYNGDIECEPRYFGGFKWRLVVNAFAAHDDDENMNDEELDQEMHIESNENRELDQQLHRGQHPGSDIDLRDISGPSSDGNVTQDQTPTVIPRITHAGLSLRCEGPLASPEAPERACHVHWHCHAQVSFQMVPHSSELAQSVLNESYVNPYLAWTDEDNVDRCTTWNLFSERYDMLESELLFEPSGNLFSTFVGKEKNAVALVAIRLRAQEKIPREPVVAPEKLTIVHLVHKSAFTKSKHVVGPWKSFNGHIWRLRIRAKEGEKHFPYVLVECSSPFSNDGGLIWRSATWMERASLSCFILHASSPVAALCRRGEELTSSECLPGTQDVLTRGSGTFSNTRRPWMAHIPKASMLEQDGFFDDNSTLTIVVCITPTVAPARRPHSPTYFRVSTKEDYVRGYDERRFAFTHVFSVESMSRLREYSRWYNFAGYKWRIAFQRPFSLTASAVIVLYCGGPVGTNGASISFDRNESDEEVSWRKRVHQSICLLHASSPVAVAAVKGEMVDPELVWKDGPLDINNETMLTFDSNCSMHCVAWLDAKAFFCNDYIDENTNIVILARLSAEGSFPFEDSDEDGEEELANPRVGVVRGCTDTQQITAVFQMLGAVRTISDSFQESCSSCSLRRGRGSLPGELRLVLSAMQHHKQVFAHSAVLSIGPNPAKMDPWVAMRTILREVLTGSECSQSRCSARKGKFIKGTSHEIRANNNLGVLPFSNISVPVDGCRDLYESFERLHRSNLWDMFSIGDWTLQGAGPHTFGKSVQIARFPSILHLRLQRYEHRKTSKSFLQLTDRYEFYPEMDLSRFEKVSEADDIFVLNAVIGVDINQQIFDSSPRGRIFTFIRSWDDVDFNESMEGSSKWFRYDIHGIREVASETVFKLSFGQGGPWDERVSQDGHSENFSFAYILQYLRKSELEHLLYGE